MFYPWSAPRLQDGDYFSSPNLNSHKLLAELAILDTNRTYRWMFADDNLNTQYWSMNASYYGMRSFQAYLSPLPYKQFDEVFQRFDLSHYYPLLGAKYYLCRPCDKRLLRNYKLRGRYGDFDLYVSSEALSRYAIVNHVAGSYQSAEDFYNIINRGYDFARSVYVQRQDAALIMASLGNQTSRPAYVLKAEKGSLNQLTVSVNAAVPTLFLLNEYSAPEWKATINGKPAPVFTVNLNQMAVILNRGASLVEFKYQPTLFIALLRLQQISLAALIAYVALLLSRRFTYRRSTGGVAI